MHTRTQTVRYRSKNPSLLTSVAALQPASSSRAPTAEALRLSIPQNRFLQGQLAQAQVITASIIRALCAFLPGGAVERHPAVLHPHTHALHKRAKHLPPVFAVDSQIE